MGAGIAEVFAREGYTVVGVEQNDEGVTRGSGRQLRGHSDVTRHQLGDLNLLFASHQE